MKNHSESPEPTTSPVSMEGQPVSEGWVIEILNNFEVDSPQAIEAVQKYIDQCHTEADIDAAENGGDAVANNRANIKAEIKIATMFCKTQKYKQYGINNLSVAYMNAKENDVTADLAVDAESLIKLFRNE